MLIGRRTIGTIAYMGGLLALPEPFVWSWSQMIQYNSEYLVQQTERINYDRATVSYHSMARNSLVDRIQGEWLLMLDTDHSFEPDIAARMLNKMNYHNIDVLVAPYIFKGIGSAHAPVLYGYNPKTKKRFVLGDWSREVDVMPIHAAGAGCLMVRKTVFDKIKNKLNQNPFEILNNKKMVFSEDLSFFERLYKLKIQPYFATTIDVKHLIYKELSINEDYNRDGLVITKEMEVLGLK